MGETLQPFTTRFNKSLRVESRAERLTGDAGVVVLREIMEHSGIVEWMIPQLTDPRRREDVVHDLRLPDPDKRAARRSGLARP